ncbi:WXG100 family type VII secretion target [Saccharopolyspora rosea]|uniref:WXG100 family type VII secretion target n=1 Tax=Saccharopolyspora rosea TaxID=524884 RepID=A0ABW3FSW3_9PSEU|nr:WXG100 family type VII secretion target [Saccharopolyspora rosea]
MSESAGTPGPAAGGAENPLVAKPQDSTEWYTGIPLAEAIADAVTAIENGSWADAGVAGIGVGLEALSAVTDPLGTLFSGILSFLAEHFQPLTDALDWLAGNADAVRAHARTWRNVADSLRGTADGLDSDVQRGTAGWTGATADAYRARLTATAQLIRAQSDAARGLASATEQAGEMVAVVRTTVRDFIADCAGRLAAWAVETLATDGFGILAVLEQATVRIARWGTRVVEMINKLIRALTRLLPMLGKLGDLIRRISKILNDIAHGKPLPGHPRKPGEPEDPHTPHNPNDPPDEPPGHDRPGPAENPEDRQRLIEEAQAEGHKISPDKVVEIGKDPNGRIVWLEEGKGGERGAGLEHIYEEHGKQFEEHGIPRENVPDFVHRAVTQGRYTGHNQGNPPGRPIYEIDYNGERHFVAVSVGKNGFIVGANMRSPDNPFGGTKRDGKLDTDPNYRGW